MIRQTKDLQVLVDLPGRLVLTRTAWFDEWDTSRVELGNRVHESWDTERAVTDRAQAALRRAGKCLR